VDLDAVVAAHRPTWTRLEQLLRRRRRLTGAEVDELVELYQRTATHLSVVRTASPDGVLVGNLSSLVARARSAVIGAHAPAWADLRRFFVVSFPVVAYQARRWWLGAGLASLAVAYVIGVWVAGNPEAQAAMGAPDDIRRLVNRDFADYYSENPAASFAGQVWVNNAWVSLQVIASAVLLGLPIPFILFTNAANGGAIGGLMAAHGKADVFWGLILPHGLLELTAVFLAAGVGMRLGWTVVDPGLRPRAEVLAEQGRAVMSVALGLVVVLLVSGLVEAGVTPSGMPTWARVGVGILAEVTFLAYVVVLGRRALAAGETGDVERPPDVAPSAG
jgi:uncharacterized membrane protein SpoIIM required for sporulation